VKKPVQVAGNRIEAVTRVPFSPKKGWLWKRDRWKGKNAKPDFVYALGKKKGCKRARRDLQLLTLGRVVGEK